MPKQNLQAQIEAAIANPTSTVLGGLRSGKDEFSKMDLEALRALGADPKIDQLRGKKRLVAYRWFQRGLPPDLAIACMHAKEELAASRASTVLEHTPETVEPVKKETKSDIVRKALTALGPNAMPQDIKYWCMTKGGKGVSIGLINTVKNKWKEKHGNNAKSNKPAAAQQHQQPLASTLNPEAIALATKLLKAAGGSVRAREVLAVVEQVQAAAV